jgi:hypothetical protein
MQNAYRLFLIVKQFRSVLRRMALKVIIWRQLIFLKNTNFTMHFKYSQRPSILADANSINQSLDNQLAFFTHLRIVFNLNLVNIKRLPPLIYHFNFSEYCFHFLKRKLAKTELLKRHDQRTNTLFRVPARLMASTVSRNLWRQITWHKL